MLKILFLQRFRQLYIILPQKLFWSEKNSRNLQYLLTFLDNEIVREAAVQNVLV